MTRRWLLLTTTAVLLGSAAPRAAEPLDRLTPATFVGTWEGVDRYYENHLRLLVRRGDDSRLQGTLVVAPAHPDDNVDARHLALYRLLRCRAHGQTVEDR